VPPQYAFQ